MISSVHKCLGLRVLKNTLRVLFKIFHTVYAFAPNVEQLDKFVLPAKYVHFVCLKFNVSFK